jgi:hypothetical protein
MSGLRAVIEQYFDEEELRTLCSDLGVDYDSLPGDGKAAKARELAGHFARRGQEHLLAVTIAGLRPNAVEELARYAGDQPSASLLTPHELENGGSEYRALTLSLFDRVFERVGSMSDEFRDRFRSLEESSNDRFNSLERSVSHIRVGMIVLAIAILMLIGSGILFVVLTGIGIR